MEVPIAGYTEEEKEHRDRPPGREAGENHG
jgi:hypothetical protein